MRTITSTLTNKCMSGYDPSFSVNHFFFEKNCFLKDYFTDDKKQAGNIVEHYCKLYDLNQRILIVTLQREQGLISAEKPVDNLIMTRATGCGVWDDGTVIERYRGFEKQISGACATYRRWYDDYSVGKTHELLTPKEIVICGSPVVYSLLKYTPHESSLRLSEKVYTRYFGV
jgi:hypothetical protein